MLLGVCVFFHELGHFLVGKWVGIRPRVFSIGYGRGLFFKRRKGTIYQITAIPFGGYVQFYGDDPTKEKKTFQKGDFFSAGPWRRMALAFAGPMFSILLGFFIVFILIQTGHRTMSTTVRVENKSEAAKAGLMDGDKILTVNGSTTRSFERILYEVAFAKEDTVKVMVDRQGTKQTLSIPVSISDPGTPGTLAGVRPLARLVLSENREYPGGLKRGDILLRANNVELNSVPDLIRELNKADLDVVQVDVFRPSLPKRQSDSNLHLVIPLLKKPSVKLTNLVDQQTGKKIPDIEFVEESGDEFKRIFINNESFSTFAEFRKAVEVALENETLQLRIGPVDFNVEAKLAYRRQIGIRPEEVYSDHSIAKSGIFDSVIISADETVFITKSTLVGLWRIIEGKLSFNKSVSGPVKMVAIAKKTAEMGWQTYFLLMAQITIILGVMNLLPIPVLDGGHILFYLIEAVYKPISLKTQAIATRVGMTLMIGMGVYVILLDLYDVFIKKSLG